MLVLLPLLSSPILLHCFLILCTLPPSMMPVIIPTPPSTAPSLAAGSADRPSRPGSGQIPPPDVHVGLDAAAVGAVAKAELGEGAPALPQGQFGTGTSFSPTTYPLPLWPNTLLSHH